MSGGQTMPRSTPRLRIATLANFAFLLVVPALYLEVVSLTRHLAPGNPFYAALDALGRDAQLGAVSAVFTAATLLGPVLAITLCLLAVLRLEWRREPGGFVTTLHVHDRLLPLATIGLSMGVLALLFLYAFFENFAPR
jgi:hypothetical protein